MACVSNPEMNKLLILNYSKLTNQFEVDQYIRDLRNALKKKIMQNDFLLKKESYIPIKCNYEFPFKEEIMEYSMIKDIDRDFIAITLTFDQKMHPQLIITPQYDQIKYIKKVISNLIYENHITAVYGCFEKHKSGYIHSHLLVPHYGSHNDLQDKILPYFTNRKKQHAVLIKHVDDLKKWIDYINKESDDFIEWNLRKNTLEI